MKDPKHIGIVGAGLVGSLLSIYLARRGYRISLFDRRPDLRQRTSDEGRSINLALSNRGLRALQEVGLAEEARTLAIPMHGRMMHDPGGKLTYLSYGKQGQFINSISRNDLNAVLIDHAEKKGVRIHFEHRCLSADPETTSATFQTPESNGLTFTFDLLTGADGAFSAVRDAMRITDRFNYTQHYLDHGYKELQIPAASKGAFVMEKNALHIWPRESFMMIALPNPDGSFTTTLFLPFEGTTSFASLSDDHNVRKFFTESLPDVLRLMPDLENDYRRNPTSSLVTIKCFPWARRNTFLVGDAAHAIVPFYGQGMNAGFEDCRILNKLLDEHDDQWPHVLETFQNMRKQDTDAIAELAFDNFIEMRDLVADAGFLLRKKIEAKLHELFPEQWIPLYSMVTFRDDIPYAEAFRTGKKQALIMDEVMKTPRIETEWTQLDFKELVGRLT